MVDGANPDNPWRGPFRAAFRRKDTAFAEHALALPENGRAKSGLFKMERKKESYSPNMELTPAR